MSGRDKRLAHTITMKNRLQLVAVALACLTCGLPLTTQAAQTNAASLFGSVVQGFAGRTVNVPWGLRLAGSNPLSGDRSRQEKRGIR